MNTREIRKRIASIKKTQQITKAMKMVAAVRYRKAHQNLISNRPYKLDMEMLMKDLVSKKPDSYNNVCFTAPEKAEKEMLVVITSDKGLCGSFNSTLLKGCLKYLKTCPNPVDIITVGKKGRDYLTHRGFKSLRHYSAVMNNLNYAGVVGIINDILRDYKAKKYRSVNVLFNEFKIVTQAKTKNFLLLPVSIDGVSGVKSEFIFEPNVETLLERLLPKYLGVVFYGILLESNASEQGLRMTSMEQATTNADDIIKKLTLVYNQTRQASITKELSDLVGGAAAVS
ncbi:MAG: ATP synthase F1 subunit gamma [Candidatus Firestonebacteria bacterium RIFOXYC2_FULL_39_67]|nr:MAG: ATP synthase F1 subunit gamma [Candidatus Firestonebacteria bacterium RIFOXYD2_FULL_39_29]OGF55112.1 MAG: ATP synthase F1 subunit gamma [Candidatus Firestonebacteria bacterium RIFOXYC2_FULL_39_67]